MKRRLLPAFAMFALTASPALADEDTDLKEGETPEQRDMRLAAQAGHYAAGVRVHAGGAGADSFNFIGLELRGRYNVTDSINVGARIPFALSKPDGFGVFGGAMARAELRLGATVGAAAEAGFMKYGAVALTDQDVMAFLDGADYEVGFTVGPWVKAKAGPTYLAFTPYLWYQMGDEALTGVNFPVTAMFRAGSVGHAGAKVSINTGDDFKFGADEGARIAAGLVADLKVSTITLVVGAGIASLLTDDAGLYTSVGKAFYIDVALMYGK